MCARARVGAGVGAGVGSCFFSFLDFWFFGFFVVVYIFRF